MPLCLLLVYLLTTGSGICYSSLSYVSDRDLINRAVSLSKFSDGVLSKNDDFPHCKVAAVSSLSGGEIFFNALLGRNIKQVECALSQYPYSESGYYLMTIAVNSCANRLIDVGGYDLSELGYKKELQNVVNFDGDDNGSH